MKVQTINKGINKSKLNKIRNHMKEIHMQKPAMYLNIFEDI